MRRTNLGRPLDLAGRGRLNRAMGQDLGEAFDVVDEQDRVIGQAARGEVHARGWRHRAVHVFLTNRAGQVFLHQRSLRKDTFPGKWNSSCAGHVAAGDDYDATVPRELEEELGCRLERAPARLLKLPAGPETGQEFVWVYHGVSEGPFALNPAEILRGAWFSPEQIDAWTTRAPEDFATSFLHVWPRVCPLLAKERQG